MSLSESEPNVDPQNNRTMGITLFGTDSSHGLVLDGFECTEHISGLFRVEAQLSTSLAPADAEILIQPRLFLGQKVTIRVDLPNDQVRYFCGVVTRWLALGEDQGRMCYQAEISPWLWLLSQTSDCRVFQNKSVVEIVKSIVEELSLSFGHLLRYPHDILADIKTVGERNGHHGDHSQRDICVQYNETSLNFVQRLLEEEGICFFFHHGKDFSQLVLVDDPAKHAVCPHQPTARQVPDSRRYRAGDCLLSWAEETTLTAGVYALRDHHFEEFSHVLVKRDAIGRARPQQTLGGNERLEIYEYGGGFAEPFNEQGRGAGRVLAEANARAKWRVEAETSEQAVFVGESTCRAFLPGFVFDRDLSLDPKSVALDPAGPFLLTQVVHFASLGGTYSTSGGTRSSLQYQNRFRCVPAPTGYRPQQVTPKPVIHGVQTAKVVGAGPDGDSDQDEIHVDKYGRIKVKFHWDRTTNTDDRCSAWMRVGQLLASGSFGAFFWPRVGDEVIVAFEDGDPDRPLVVGSVYNSANMPPYALPDQKTKSGIKTKSTKHGTPWQNFNELRFEDKKDHEQIYVHAERDLDTVIESAETRRIGAKRRTEIGDANAPVEPGSKLVEEQLIHGDREITVDGDDVRLVEGDIWMGTMRDGSFAAAQNLDFFAEQGKITLEALQFIELKVGLNSIRIDQAGVWIDALNVAIQGKLLASVHAPLASMTADGAATVSGPLTNILSTGPLILKGAAAGMTY